MITEDMVERINRAGSIWLVEAGEDELLMMATAERLSDEDRVALTAALAGQSEAAQARKGWKLVPVELTPEIACALEMCGPPETQTPEAVAALVKDYSETWSHVLAAAPQPDGEKI